jgi:ABC-type arginine transport system permease subunit
VKLNRSGAGLFFLLFAVMLAVFYGIACAASDGSPEPEAVLAAVVGAAVLAGVTDLLLILWIWNTYGPERLKKIERIADIIFLAAVFVPLLIWSVWMWLHSIFF